MLSQQISWWDAYSVHPFNTSQLSPHIRDVSTVSCMDKPWIVVNTKLRWQRSLSFASIRIDNIRRCACIQDFEFLALIGQMPSGCLRSKAQSINTGGWEVFLIRISYLIAVWALCSSNVQYLADALKRKILLLLRSILGVATKSREGCCISRYRYKGL